MPLNKLHLTLILSQLFTLPLLAQPNDDLIAGSTPSSIPSPASARSETPSAEDQLDELLGSFLLRRDQVIRRKNIEFNMIHGAPPMRGTLEYTTLQTDIDVHLLTLADTYATDLIALIYRHRIRTLPVRFLERITTPQFLRITANLHMEDLEPAVPTAERIAAVHDGAPVTAATLLLPLRLDELLTTAGAGF